MALRLASSFLPRDADAEDLVQEAFTYGFQRLNTLENPHAFSSWLAKIVVRSAGKWMRRDRLLFRLGLKRVEPIDADSVIARVAPPEVLLELRELYESLETFPAGERIALLLRRVDGYDISEIAEYMGISVSTAKRRLRAAEKRLERRQHSSK